MAASNDGKETVQHMLQRLFPSTYERTALMQLHKNLDDDCIVGCDELVWAMTSNDDALKKRVEGFFEACPHLVRAKVWEELGLNKTALRFAGPAAAATKGGGAAGAGAGTDSDSDVPPLCASSSSSSSDEPAHAAAAARRRDEKARKVEEMQAAEQDALRRRGEAEAAR
eukprot:CAMPEP_0177719334 /NCGR_PEP_ID=MMETSP0484_2-20121128/16048_1 /TAXON_ID=354590 /ORGANISM="Rhodomonas lens, Strain RHODO" /LENGTH=168 /DNA_ID=CAMNT_0019231545 /DNA_START=108 /DNA_END=611 /DNA_ORIENTATION=+